MEELHVCKEKNGCQHVYCDEYKNLIDRVVRWDKYRIDQLSITNNLIFTLSLAFLGFLVNSDHEILNCNCWFFSIRLLSFFFLIVSLITGSWTSYNRLVDFRITSKLTKKERLLFEVENKMKDDVDIDEIRLEVKSFKQKTSSLGECTWVLLQFQLWSFTFGSILGLVLLMI